MIADAHCKSPEKFTRSSPEGGRSFPGRMLPLIIGNDRSMKLVQDATVRVRSMKMWNRSLQSEISAPAKRILFCEY